MKFTTNGKDFKAAVDRLSAINSKGKCSLSNMNLFQIVASKEGVTMAVYSSEGYAEIYLKADVQEEGMVYVDYSDLILAYDLQGQIEIMFTGKNATISNDKKKRLVCSRECEGEFGAYMKPEDSIEFQKVFEVRERYWLNAVEKVDAAKAKDDTRPALQGLYFHGKAMRMVGLDGYRMHWIDLEEILGEPTDCNIILPGCTYAHLKSLLSARKQDSMISFWQGGVFIMMKGDDWKYTTRVIEAVYVQEEQIIPKTTVPGFQVSVKELAAVAKEHAKKKCEHTILTCRNNSMYALAKLDTYGACDRIEVAMEKSGVPDKFLAAFAPKQIVDALNCCDEEDVDVFFSADNADKRISMAPLMLFKNGNFSSLLLPFRVAGNSQILSFTEMMFA